jgi:uncharacterized protein (TIGR00645 family)
MEQKFERLLYASRWVLAPIYFGLSIALFALAIKFFQELLHLFPNILELSEDQLVLTLLGLIDMALVGALIVMVMFSGYENFVSDIDVAGVDKLGWLSHLDPSTIKLKVAVSIVAISAIHLLRAFMDAQKISNDKLMWYVIIHLTFVVSAVLMGYLDKLVFAAHRKH